MKLKNIVIGLFAATVIGGVIWNFTRKPKGSSESNDDDDSQDDSKKEGEMTPPETLSDSKSSSAYSSSGGATSFPPTPFKDKSEGNAFRVWVNKNHPDKAKSFNLDLDGDFNNQHIRKAFVELGSAFQKTMDSSSASKLAADKKKVEDKYNAETRNMLVITPDTKNKDVESKGGISVRNTPEVNDGAINNRVKQLKIGESLEYINEVKGADQLKWYKVKVKNKYGRDSFGYVRSDVVTKKSIRVPK